MSKLVENVNSSYERKEDRTEAEGEESRGV